MGWLGSSTGPRAFVFNLLCLCLTLPTEQLGTATEQPAGVRPPPRATMADVAWLEGRWVGPALGGESEQVWSAPRARAMIGMFRLVRDGVPVFYEFQTLVEERGSLILRLRHFGPGLSSWEGAEPQSFPLLAVEPARIQFEGLSFVRRSVTTLTVYVAIREKDGRVHEEAFDYARTDRRQGER
jgi:hypothetical protein